MKLSLSRERESTPSHVRESTPPLLVEKLFVENSEVINYFYQIFDELPFDTSGTCVRSKVIILLPSFRDGDSSSSIMSTKFLKTRKFSKELFLEEVLKNRELLSELLAKRKNFLFIKKEKTSKLIPRNKKFVYKIKEVLPLGKSGYSIGKTLLRIKFKYYSPRFIEGAKDEYAIDIFIDFCLKFK